MKEKKKLDWVSIIGVTLSVAGLFWWQSETQKKFAERQKLIAEQKAAAAAAAPSPGASATGTTPEATPAPTATPATPVTPAVPATPALPEQTFQIASIPPLLDLTFTNRGGGIRVAGLSTHKGVGENSIELNKEGSIPIGALSENGAGTTGADYTFTQTPNSVTFERVTEKQVKIAKTFTIPENPDTKNQYIVNLEVAFTNVGAAPYENKNYFVHIGSAEPIHTGDLMRYEGFDWNRNGDIEKVSTTWFDAFSLLGISFRGARPVYQEMGENVRWASVKNQFYTTMIFPEGTLGNQAWATRINVPVPGHDGVPRKMQALEGAIGMPGIKVGPGETVRQQFRLYIGPKAYSRLNALGNEADEILNFWPFEFVSVFLLSAMNLFNGWFGNYATAIIVLTILIKLALWPLQSKSMRSMKEMAALAPKIAELKEKYADDPTRMNQEAMALYKQYGVNPLAGCLPLLVQIPIFFGFYSMLGTAVELRNSSFLWVKDLTQPDTVATVLGLPINLLPLVMAGTMLWQMNLTPKTGDKMQQRIFMFMPLIFIVFCYNYASALPLYWTVQNIFSIVQIYLTRDKPVPPLRKKTPEPAPSKSGKGKKKRN